MQEMSRDKTQGLKKGNYTAAVVREDNFSYSGAARTDDNFYLSVSPEPLPAAARGAAQDASFIIKNEKI
jgi:hypothetical protein